jgi:hypothetical protein
MIKTTINIVIVLVFLFTGYSFSAGNNKHFYKVGLNGGDGDKTSIKNDDYHLFQNYPNPFNPVTRISYQTNKEGYVRLQVFNLVGQIIKVLVSEEQQPGRYEVEFDAADLPTGVYLYKLQINDFTSVKRMTLLK